ncbi:MAG: AMP-dependent synthetase/ligase [Myxococcota bacterium]
MPADTIPARLFANAARIGDSPAWYTKADGAWAPRPWRDVAGEIRRATRALIALGLQPGHTVCILGFNRPEWVAMDVAAMCAGGVPAGIYTTCSSNEVAYILRHAESRFVLLENADQLAKVEKERASLPALEHLVMMRGAPALPGTLTWDEFLAKGDAVADAEVDARVAALLDDQLATLIYTSGTTGPPKAVMLSHRNLAWTAAAAKGIVDLRADDCVLSYLPLSHIAEQMFTIHAPITVGSAVYFAEALELVPDNLKEVQPTIFFGVPRIWEKFHAGITNKLRDATGVKAKLVAWAMDVGKRVAALKREGKPVTGWLAVQHQFADGVIYKKLKPAIGLGRARICVSGAAPIAREVLEFFGGLDVHVLEVYGQSEDSGPTSFNLPGKTKLGTVGPPIPGVEVKLAEDGEVLVRGPNVFLGYYKDPVATAETLKDGWLCSGDLGAFDEQGFLSIVGRKKEIIITAGGKNIAPKNIEEALKSHPLVGEAVVIGDRRPYLVALLTLEPDALARLGGAPGDASVQAELQKAVDAANELFARVEHVRKFAVLPAPFSVDGGELTPSLKIKRRVVAQKYEREIEGLYTE